MDDELGLSTKYQNKNHSLSCSYKKPYKHCRKNSGIQNSIYVHNLYEESLFLKVCEWRKETSMPIIKVYEFQVEDKKCYPKKCKVLTERISKKFEKIHQVQIGSCLYLLKEALLGFQTLLTKFGSIQLSKTEYGINKSGQCKVWSPKKLNQPQTKNNQSKALEVFNFFFQKILQIVKNSHRQLLFKLQNFINSKININFLQIYTIILKFAEKQKFPIPQNLRSMKSSKYLKSKNVSDHLLKSNKNFGGVGRGKKSMDWVYASPPKNIKSQIKINWNYCNPNEGLRSINDIQRRRSMRYSNPKNVSNTFVTTSKNSLWTTQFSDSQKEEHSLLGPLEKIHTKQQVASVVMDELAPKRKQEPKISIAYNFGGLLQVPEYEQSSQIEKSLSGRQVQSFINMQDARPKQLTNENKFAGFWDSRKMINILQKKSLSIKQSLYFEGSEQKPTLLNIKLDKLGKLGREIAGSLIPPQK